MLDLRFFKNPSFAAATTAITLVFFAMLGSYFLFTQYLQFVHGYDPLLGRRADPALGARLPGVSDAVGEAGRALRPTIRGGIWPHHRRARLRDPGGDQQRDRQLLVVRVRYRGAGAGHGDHDRAVDRSDHAVAAAAQGGRRFGGERHHPRARRRPRRRGDGEPGVIPFPQLDAGRGERACRRRRRTRSPAHCKPRPRLRGAHGGAIAHAAQTSFVDAFSSTLWVAAAVVVAASGLVAWLLRPRAMAAAEAIVDADERPSDPSSSSSNRNTAPCAAPGSPTWMRYEPSPRSSPTCSGS